MTDDARASQMYPSMAQEDPPSGAGDTLLDGGQPAARTVPAHDPSVPAHIRQLRDTDDPANRIYKPETMITAIPDDLFDDQDLPADTRRAAVHEVRRMIVDLGMGNLDVQEMMSRSAALKANPVPVEQLRRETNKLMARTFGEDADQALSDAKKLARRDPRTARMLEKWGLGDDPETILKFAQQARRERNRGRLK